MREGDEHRLEVRASVIEGAGCFAVDRIPAGAMVREYTGERISQEEARRREADPRRRAIYTLWLDDGSVIDGAHGGNETIYINHACAPNCFLHEAEGRVFVGAAREIEAGEELTIDYAYDPATPLEPCRCGGAACRGYINDVAGTGG